MTAWPNKGLPFRVRVRLRRGDWLLKPGVEALDGCVIETRALWPIEPDEDRGGIYRGEWAMAVPHDWPITWIAEGDLEVLA